jgi:hypothetical protein
MNRIRSGAVALALTLILAGCGKTESPGTAGDGPLAIAVAARKKDQESIATKSTKNTKRKKWNSSCASSSSW